MKKIKLSVIIPSYKDPNLIKTLNSLLQSSELGNQLEIIVVFDGYYPTFPLIQDPRVRYVHDGKNQGMRGSINTGVSLARGEFLMRTDEHCAFGQGYDRILTESCQPNWIISGRRYYLDVDKWEIMNIPPVDCEKLVVQGGVKFAGQKWDSRAEQLEDQPIIESMAMQGSVWVMSRKWWDEVIGKLQTEGYGPLIQDSHEMVFKTWKAGGKLMVNKQTWYAHRHRDFGRTHNHGTKENPANEDAGYAYALDVWGNYYQQEIKPRWQV